MRRFWLLWRSVWNVNVSIDTEYPQKPLEEAHLDRIEKVIFPLPLTDGQYHYVIYDSCQLTTSFKVE